MKVTYNWLKDFVEIKLPPSALAEKLTMAGLEVVGLEERGGDFVFEIEITSNRPDWLSVLGIAREIAAITGKRLKLNSLVDRPQAIDHRKKKNKKVRGSLTVDCGLFAIRIENKSDCPLYAAKIIQDVKVGPSPQWLKSRLESIGCRSVNNIVDITNYILFTYGEPLHAFDLDKIQSHKVTRSQGHKSEIIVRRAGNTEKIITIDGVERMLDPEILVIADSDKPIAIAGVMGGKDAEVTEKTRNILLEAAVFNPIVIRRGRQKLGLQSDSSYRFERGVDRSQVEAVSKTAAGFIQEMTGGVTITQAAQGTRTEKTKKIKLELGSVRKKLGADIPAEKIKKILQSLGFKALGFKAEGFEAGGRARGGIEVGIPSHRPDVNAEIDLIEEIARIFGYDRIPVSLPAIKPQARISDQADRLTSVKQILTGLGLQEVITYSLVDQAWLKAWGAQGPFLEIANPLSLEQSVLRPTLIPSLLKCVAGNLNQKQNHISIFEIAKAFSGSGAKTSEELSLGIALCGTRSLFLSQGPIKEDACPLHLKGILEILFDRLGIQDYSLEAKDQGAVIYLKEKPIGYLSQVPRAVLEGFEIKNRDLFVLEIAMEKILSSMSVSRKFIPLSVYPSVSRDVSFTIKEDIKAGEIINAIKEKAGPLLREVKITDYYKGKQIPPGFKGLTLSCVYRSDERTLTEAEINPVHSLIGELLAGRFGAQPRA